MKKIKYGLISLLCIFLLVGCSSPVKKEQKKKDVKLESNSSKKVSNEQNSSEKDKEKEEKNQEDFEEQKKENIKKQEVEKVLSLDNPEKYVEAYHEFTMKGNPMPPEQRGSSPIPTAARLSNDKYSEIGWGICDYYGNAFNQGIITEEQNINTQKLALEKLNSGGYGDSSNQEEIINITSDNVIDYLDEYVHANSPWELSYISVETADDGVSQRVIFESKVKSGVRGYFIVTPDGKISRYSFMGELLGDLEDIDF